MKGCKKVMEYLGKVANIKRWVRFGFLKPEEGTKALKQLKEEPKEEKMVTVRWRVR